MDHIPLEALFLTEEEYQTAHKQVREAAYYQWLSAGCPPYRELEFWLAAESEWVQFCYVPDRYATADELHQTG